MLGWKILPVILNYNQPEEADKIYEKLINDGFKDIISVDNGSDLKPKAKFANFTLPKNIKAVGQIKMALIYAMDYFPADYYWIINTSSELVDNVNYKTALNKSILSITKDGINPGIISPSLISDETMKHQIYNEETSKDFSIACWCECISPLISHKLLEKTRQNNTGFFEPETQRGWTAGHEIGFEAVKNELWWVLDHKLPVKWNKNIGYKKNVGGESLKKYKTEAASEMKRILRRKYGVLWRLKIYLSFIKSTKKKKFPYEVIPYDPFGVWKLFFTKIKEDKPVKMPSYYCVF